MGVAAPNRAGSLRRYFSVTVRLHTCSPRSGSGPRMPARALPWAGTACATGNGSPHREPVSTISFRDVAPSAGLRFERTNGATGRKWLPETMGGGGGFVDYDNDGWPDIVLVDGRDWHGIAGRSQHQSVRLFHNDR